MPPARIGYNVNMKARGLRLARSGLAGMIMPHYRNRFFAGLSETFEAGARARGFCPMVVSTQRNPETEREVVERLLSHQVEFLFIVGVANPEPLNDLCRAANIPCVNIDLPGANAPSVVTDNQGGARMLTDILLDKIAAPDPAFHFLGGIAGEYATEERIVGFTQALAARGIALPESHIHRCGYWPPTARASIEAPLRPTRRPARRPLHQLHHRVRGCGPVLPLPPAASLRRPFHRLLRLGPLRGLPALPRHHAAPECGSDDRAGLQLYRKLPRRRSTP